MARVLVAVALLLVVACSGERTDCEVWPVVQPRGAPRTFLFCGDTAVAECWDEPRESGFRWGALYCEGKEAS